MSGFQLRPASSGRIAICGVCISSMFFAEMSRFPLISPSLKWNRTQGSRSSTLALIAPADAMLSRLCQGMTASNIRILAMRARVVRSALAGAMVRSPVSFPSGSKMRLLDKCCHVPPEALPTAYPAVEYMMF